MTGCFFFIIIIIHLFQEIVFFFTPPPLALAELERSLSSSVTSAKIKRPALKGSAQTPKERKVPWGLITL